MAMLNNQMVKPILKPPSQSIQAFHSAARSQAEMAVE